MKIETVKPVLLKGTRGYDAWVLVRIQTDEGIEGIGECFSWSYGDMSMALKIRDNVLSIGSELEGNIPLEIDAFLNRFSHLGAGHEWYAAISGIEIALWDILGQTLNRPIHLLLGDTARENIPLYANHGVFGEAVTLEERVERAIVAKEAGFGMFKWDPFGDIRGTPSPAQLKKAIKEVESFRDGLGDDFDIAIDAHARFSLEGALMAARELEAFDIVFFEEPTDPPDQPELLKKVANSTSIPIATGERMTTQKEADEVLEIGAIGIIQPEPGANGGIMETFKVAQAAAERGVRVATHNWCGPILALATSHICSTITNLYYMEYASTAPEDEWEKDLLEHPIQVENGKMILSDRIGLGSRPNEEILASRLLG